MSYLTRRQSRRIDFEFFAGHARAAFQRVSARDSRHGPFELTYGFYVLPGGHFGGRDERIIEIFYGKRPFERVTEVIPQERSLPTLRDRLLTETGAMLLYQRGDNGVVLCTLYPAHSENYRRREDAILLSIIRGTHVLTGAPALERHWRELMSYMQCTCLEGEPTIADRFRVWWLLWTRTLVIEKKEQTPRIWLAAARLIGFSATVGLSGFLLALVQWWLLKCPVP